MGNKNTFEGSSSYQAEFDFDPVGAEITALCYNENEPYLKRISKKVITSIGGGKYVDDKDLIYVRALDRGDSGSEPRFVATREYYVDPRENI